MPTGTPAPYNVTLTSQTPTLKYAPARDGLPSLGWNVTYSGTPIPNKPYYGVGTSSHRTTLAGATLEVDFTGTAAYVLGSAPQGAFTVTVDGADPVPGSPDPAQNLLVGVKGLSYGEHKVIITVVQPVQVSVDGAILTVGLGTGAPPVSRTINTVLFDNTIRPNPFFSFRSPNKPWQLEAPKYIYDNDVPMVIPAGMTTAGGQASQGSIASFVLNQTSAFFIRGCMLPNASDDLFSVTVSPPPSLGPPKKHLLSPNSSWEDPNEVLFWTSGMNSDWTYLVEFKSEVAGKDSFLGFRSVETLDAGSLGTAASLKGSSALSSSPLSGSTVTGLAALLVCMFKLLW